MDILAVLKSKKETLLKIFPVVGALLLGLYLGFLAGSIIGYRSGVLDGIAQKQELVRQQAQEKRAEEEAKRQAKEEERRVIELRNQKLDEFLEDTEFSGKNLATIPFWTGEVKLNPKSFRGFLNPHPQYATITPNDQNALFRKFERKWKVRIISYIIESERIVVSFAPDQ